MQQINFFSCQGTLFAVLFVSVASLVVLCYFFASPSAAREWFVPKAPTFALIVRTYSGEKRLHTHLLPSASMFVDGERFPLVIVLDAEEANDHRLGECLERYNPRNWNIRYEALPGNASTIAEVPFFAVAFNPWARNAAYAHPGYMRQLWSTYYLEQHTSADIIGVVDADTSFFGVLTAETIHSDDGVLFIRAMTGDRYVGDAAALNATTSDRDFNAMRTNRNPMWFHRSTFSACRRHIATNWNSTFDEAFTAFMTRKTSPVNVLSQFAILHQPELYQLVLQNDTRGIVSVASNKWKPQQVVSGCCATWNVACDQVTAANYSQFLLRYDNIAVAWLANAMLAQAHIVCANRAIGHLSTRQVVRMRSACLHYQSYRGLHDYTCQQASEG